jgi:protein-tyrosine phosphatase
VVAVTAAAVVIRRHNLRLAQSIQAVVVVRAGVVQEQQQHQVAQELSLFVTQSKGETNEKK